MNSILLYIANRLFILPRLKHLFCPLTVGFYVLVWLHCAVLTIPVRAKLGKTRLGLSSSPVQVFVSLGFALYPESDEHTPCLLLGNESTFLLLLQRMSHVHFCNLAFDHTSILKNPQINRPEISNLACVNSMFYTPDGSLTLPLLIPLPFVFIDIYGIWQTLTFSTDFILYL